jgi:hypothetical protein
MALATTPVVTLFWPDDANEFGFVYGWDNPLIVVAGVLVCDVRTRSPPLLWIGSHP